VQRPIDGGKAPVAELLAAKPDFVVRGCTLIAHYIKPAFAQAQFSWTLQG
jgi:hypothetical protein